MYDGMRVGLAVSDWVGARVGAVDGGMLSRVLGSTLTITVGSGLTLGPPVGMHDRINVGDGVLVGTNVGTGVGGKDIVGEAVGGRTQSDDPDHGTMYVWPSTSVHSHSDD